MSQPPLQPGSPYPPTASRNALPPHARRRVPLGVAVLAVGLVAGVLAAGLAVMLQLGIGAPPVWAAAWGAMLGVGAAALPLAVIALRLVAAPHEAAAASPPAERAVAGSGAVTPLPLFFRLVDREWSRARRYHSGAALLLVGIDGGGAPAGAGAEHRDAVVEALLRDAATTLRGADLLTRYSDDRLAVFVVHADATGALDVAERIRERAERLDLHWPGVARRISVSVGVAHLRPVHSDLQALLDDAQDALGAAGQAGGNCVRAAPADGVRSPLPGAWRNGTRSPRRQPRS